MSTIPNYQKIKKEDDKQYWTIETVAVQYKGSTPLKIQSATTNDPNPFSTQLLSPQSTYCLPFSEFVSRCIFKKCYPQNHIPFIPTF